MFIHKVIHFWPFNTTTPPIHTSTYIYIYMCVCVCVCVCLCVFVGLKGPKGITLRDVRFTTVYIYGNTESNGYPKLTRLA